jgi:hypothetical protein
MKKTKKEQNSDLDAQIRLAEIMTNKPRTIKLGERTFSVTALKAGTQLLIATEAAKIAKAGESFFDVIKEYAADVPNVIRCIALAILNDKAKINGDEYQALYDYIEWETNPKEWLGVLVEVLQMLDLSFFFQLTSQVDLFRELTLTKKERSETSSSKQPPK